MVTAITLLPHGGSANTKRKRISWHDTVIRRLYLNLNHFNFYPPFTEISHRLYYHRHTQNAQYNINNKKLDTCVVINSTMLHSQHNENIQNIKAVRNCAAPYLKNIYFGHSNVTSMKQNLGRESFITK